MSADMHIHILEGVTERDVRVFQSNVLGTDFFNEDLIQEKNQRFDELYMKVANTPQIWIGEVSWLKAAMFEDPKTFVPDPIDEISYIIGDDLPVLNDDMIAKILKAMKGENTTLYKIRNDDSINELAEFLNKHKGKRVFTISW